MDEHTKARLKNAAELYKSALRRIERAQMHLESTNETGLITAAKEVTAKTQSLEYTIKWRIGNDGGKK